MNNEESYNYGEYTAEQLMPILNEGQGSFNGKIAIIDLSNNIYQENISVATIDEIMKAPMKIAKGMKYDKDDEIPLIPYTPPFPYSENTAIVMSKKLKARS
jgi:hypothetical protein